jgi:nucleotide-binding universal stress UspA family protein
MESTTLVRPDALGGPTFRRILVAVDQFDVDKSAVQLAAAIGGRSGATVKVLHVRESEFFGRATFAIETRDEAWAVVDRAVNDLRRSGLDAEGSLTSAWVDRTWQAILAEATDWKADAIVIGTPRKKLLFGHHTHDRLVRKSRLPVLVAPKPTGVGVEMTGRSTTRRAA